MGIVQKLSGLKPGESGIVKKIGSKGALRRRIIDMGITPGVRVKVVKSAPLGDPLEIIAHGYHLSMRKAEAERIDIYDAAEEQEALSSVNSLNSCGAYHFTVPAVPPRENDFQKYNVALIGNPNSGKTTLFNSLTGSYQYVGNWPGVTVGRKEGTVKNTDLSINLIDLPGVYSLSPYSPEEIVTRNYIINENPDLIINILDATNLERNLYLTTQLMELDCRVVLAVNMMDILKHRGKKIDCNFLSQKFGVPVVPVSAGKSKGIDELLKAVEGVLTSRSSTNSLRSMYSAEIEKVIDKITDMINPGKEYVPHQRFKSIKVFEDDPYVITEVGITQSQALDIEKMRDNLSEFLGKDKDIIIADERYQKVCEISRRAVKSLKKDKHFTVSDAIDKVLTGRYTAFLCFLAMIAGVFYVTFGPFGVALKNICENFVQNDMRALIEKILNYVGASPWAKSLVLDAVVGGVGAVIAFLPQVMLLFLLISLLEDCGYMARAAFIMDRPLRRFGLSGKAFVPLIMGFGCSVPAVLGTKILENKRDKNLTIFLIPFMSCSAKMPLYLLFASTFFPGHQFLAVISIYIFGVIMAAFTALIFKDSLFGGEDAPFVMEMPEYKMPSAKNVFMSVWDRTKDFVERAGTVILVATVVVWFLKSFSFGMRMVEDPAQSMLAVMGNFIAPVFSLCGFADWRACVSLLTGIMAKESIVSTLSVLYAGDNFKNLSGVLANNFSISSAVSFLVFSLLYTPCIAAIGAIHREFGKLKLTLCLIVYQLFIAFVMSAIAYQVLSLVFKFV